MNHRIYNKVCAKEGHEWAYRFDEEYAFKVCLNCGCEQVIFFPEVEWNADLDDDDSDGE